MRWKHCRCSEQNQQLSHDVRTELCPASGPPWLKRRSFLTAARISLIHSSTCIQIESNHQYRHRHPCLAYSHLFRRA